MKNLLTLAAVVLAPLFAFAADSMDSSKDSNAPAATDSSMDSSKAPAGEAK